MNHQVKHIYVSVVSLRTFLNRAAIIVPASLCLTSKARRPTLLMISLGHYKLCLLRKKNKFFFCDGGLKLVNGNTGAPLLHSRLQFINDIGVFHSIKQAYARVPALLEPRRHAAA